MRSDVSWEKLGSLLRAVGRKRKKFLFIKGLAGTLLVLLTSVSAVCLLSFVSDDPYYYTILKAAAAAALAAAAWIFLVSPLIIKRQEDDILSGLDRVSPGLGEDTLTAVELGRPSVRDNPLYGETSGLAAAHIDRTAANLEWQNLSPLYPVGRLRKFTVPLAVSAIAAAIALFIAPGSFRGFLLGTAVFPAEDARKLDLADVGLRLEFPAYTGLPPQDVSGGTGDVSAVRGTRVGFTARPLDKFRAGRLELDNGSSFPVEIGDGRIGAGFTVLGDGSYRIIEDGSGLASDTFKIAAREDSAPKISISSPDGDSIEAGANDRIDILYEAADDYGLTEFKLTWEGDAGKSGRGIEKTPAAPEAHSGRYTLDVSGLAFGGGDTVKLRVEAYDNDSVSGTKPGVSNAITVKVKDARRQHRDVMAFAERLMEELLQVLGDEVDVSGVYKTAHITEKERENNSTDIGMDSRDPDAILGAQNSLTTGIEGASVTLKRMLDAMKDDNMSDYTQFLGLANMDARIDSLLDERRNILDSFAIVDVPRLGRLMDREITEFEEDVLFLDSMIKGESLRESLLAGRELLQEYGELSELMSKLGETGDEALRAEIDNRLRELEGLMSELARKMSEMSGDVREGFLNRDAFKTLDMKSKLDQIKQMMQEGNIEQAMQMLAELQAGLQGMMASLESGYQSFSAEAMSQDMSKLNELIARIHGLEREEESLKQRTEGIKKSMLEDPESGSRSIREFIDKQKERVSEMKKNLAAAKSKASKIDQTTDTPDGSYLLDTLLQKTDELKNWLDSMDLKESHKNAKNLEETTRGLVELGDAGVGNLKDARPELGRSGELAGQIAEDLERFLGSAEDKPEASGMAGRQDEIRQDTDSLHGEIGEMGSDLPLSPSIGEKVSEAGGHMGKASESLEGNELSKALSNQDEAVKALKEAREEAEELLQKMQASAQGQGSPVPMVLGKQQQRQGTQGVDTRYVEIPAAGETEVGREFKEKILEAMKSGSPEGFSELNRKYYDRIIK